MSWWQLRVEVPVEHGETLAWLIAEETDTAVEVQDDSTMIKGVEAGVMCRLVIGSETPPGDALRLSVERWLQRFGVVGAPVEVVQQTDEAWRTGWRAWFTSRQLSPHVAVRPPWEAAPEVAGDIHTLVIDPGMAFGTGTHETTRGAMIALDELLTARAGTPTTLLDVGCGSAILTLAAWKLGADARGVEIDPVAVKNARHNLELNGGDLDTVPLDVGSASDVEGTFDVVVANIIAPILMEIAPSVSARAHGDLILSGMLAHEREAVLAAYPDFTLIAASEEGPWSILHLVRDEA